MLLSENILLQDGREILAKTEISESLVGIKGGHDETWFEVVAVQDAELAYYPAIVNGKEVAWYDFATLEEYCKHKEKVLINGLVVTVLGNACSAEVALQERGYRALAVGPNAVEIKLGRKQYEGQA